MNITRPARSTFYVSVILAILALLVSLGILRIGVSALLLLALAYIILLLGVLLRNL